MDSVPTLIKGGLAADDRGVVRFVNDFRFDGVKRFYVLENWRPGFVRAWHGHMKEAKWVTVTKGAALVCAVKITPVAKEFALCEVPFKFVLCEQQPAMLCIPPGYANGSMALVEGTQVVHFSSMTMEETAGDDLRWPWDAIPGVWEAQQR
jgi:dTDP-4-dehydrorhamnose 3,5-epimerase